MSEEEEKEEEEEEDTGENLSFSNDSWITHVKYNTKSQLMMVSTQKDSYELQGVPLEIYLGFAKAPSKGKYFNASLKGKYSHAYFK